MKTVRVNDSEFNKYWKHLFLGSGYQHPLYQTWNIRYYESLLNGSCLKNCSFLIQEQDTPFLGVCVTMNTSPDGTNKLSGFGVLPLFYVENGDLDNTQLRGAYKLLKAEFDRLVKMHSATCIIYEDFLGNGNLSFVGKYLLGKGADAVPFFRQLIDLSAPEDELFRQIRKSYKSLVNWGSKNLSLRIIDKETITLEDIERFRLLHFRAAGRETRSKHTWYMQYEMVCHDEAFVIVGELHGELVTAGLFSYSPQYCYYGVSASKREMFNKPLSHSLIWSAMLYAKDKGCNLFEMGNLSYPRQGDAVPSKKEMDISTFKQGFGGQTQVRLNITWMK